VQVNHRYVGGQTPESFDQLLLDLRSGSLADTVPPHGTLVRVRRTVGLKADRDAIVAERAAMADAQATRAADATAKAEAEAKAKADAVPDDAATVSGPPPSTVSAPAEGPKTGGETKPTGGAS
jgi:hypothetical protein